MIRKTREVSVPDLSSSSIELPKDLRLRAKIKKWNAEYPREALAARRVSDILQYSPGLKEVMSRQRLVYNSLKRSEASPTILRQIQAGINAWGRLQEFLKNTCSEICFDNRIHAKCFPDNEYGNHRAWIKSVRGQERKIAKAYQDLSIVIRSLNVQGYGSGQYESPSQKRKGAAILARYNHMLALKNR